MNMQTEQLDKLFEALSQAQSEFPTIASNRKAYTNNYADHYAIMRQVYPILKKYGLTVMPWAHRIDGIQMVGARLGHKSGQYIINSYEFIVDAIKTPQDKATHKTAGSLTYFKRYHVKDILGILLSDDPLDDDLQGPYAEKHEEEYIGIGQQRTILNLCYNNRKLISLVCRKFNVANVSQIHVDTYDSVITWIEEQQNKNIPVK